MAGIPKAPTQDTLDILCARFTSLNPDDLRRWIAEGHVRTDRAADNLVFTEIDVERVRLILELTSYP